MMLLCLTTVLAAPSFAIVRDLSADRKDYEAAVQAIDRGRWTQYEQLRTSLDSYPLAIYLDYFKLARQVHKVPADQAQQFITRSDNSPLTNRFLSLYLRQAGKSRRWQDFLQVMPTEPRSVDLQCYYYRAQLAQGERELAWQGAQRLWTHGKSQPKPCDPLFQAWQQAGQLTDDIVWTRLLNVFDARQGSLLRYVARQGGTQLQPWSDRLQAVYRAPETMRVQKLSRGDPRASDIATHGLAYLSRYNPAKALSFWNSYQQELDFSAAQVRKVESAIVKQALFARTTGITPWVEDALSRVGDDKLTELRLRRALAVQDWDAIERVLPLLTTTARGESVWRYWQARVDEKRGRSELSQPALVSLASERGYYSFLAADKLGLAYDFNDDPMLVCYLTPERAGPVVQRIEELRFHEQENLAHSEWFTMLQDTDDVQRHEALAQLAAGHGWYRMAIDAANRAKAWDSLNLRFPLPYQSTFEMHAKAAQVPSTELMAIARRESAFFPRARSPVGARGLMQIMPATGKQVASSIGRSHKNADLYEVEHNVLLGSTYYRQLLDRFDGNRIFALTAYNAGPHRVNRWRKKSQAALPVDIWVETIPFRETRKYVQAVLAYNVVFQYMMGDTHTLLTPLEEQAKY